MTRGRKEAFVIIYIHLSNSQFYLVLSGFVFTCPYSGRVRKSFCFILACCDWRRTKPPHLFSQCCIVGFY